MKARATLIRVVILAVVSALCLAAVGIISSGIRFLPTRTYAAVFTDVAGLKEGDDVKSAGVVVGQVSDITLAGKRAKVAFNLDASVSLTKSTRAAVRWKNVIGDRFIDLSAPVGDTTPLPSGATIPLSMTAPSLDIDQLSNGFRPLFRGLNTDQANKLSGELIAVLQGKGHTLDQLFTDVAAFSNGLANRDVAVGHVIDNLNTVFTTLDGRRDEVGDLIVQTDRLLAGLTSDRDTITSSLRRFNSAAGEVTSLLAETRPDIHADVDQIGRLAALLNHNSDQVTDSLSKLPPALDSIANVATRGSYLNFYLCGLQIRFTAPDGGLTETPMMTGQAGRCHR